MKITVKKTLPIIVNNFIYSLTKAAVYFTIIFLGSSIILPLILQRDTGEVAWLILLLSTGFMVLFAIRQVIDAKLHAKNTSVELTAKTINCEVSGFNSSSFSIPLNQISSVHVHQAFVDKIFDVSSVVISQIAGTVVVYGFNVSEAKAFSKAFSERQSEVYRRQPVVAER
jgi:hypothetical protein